VFWTSLRLSSILTNLYFGCPFVLRNYTINCVMAITLKLWGDVMGQADDSAFNFNTENWYDLKSSICKNKLWFLQSFGNLITTFSKLKFVTVIWNVRYKKTIFSFQYKNRWTVVYIYDRLSIHLVTEHVRQIRLIALGLNVKEICWCTQNNTSFIVTSNIVSLSWLCHQKRIRANFTTHSASWMRPPALKHI